MITRRRNGPSSSHPSTLELTPTEREVWALAEQGKTAREIALTLGKNLHSVRKRVEEARDKVRTANACKAAEAHDG